MKKLFTTSLFLVFSFGFCKAQYVAIPDTAFLRFLQTKYPTCMNGNQMDTTCSVIINATSLYCTQNNISDLTGIQYFKNLNYLECGYNNLNQLPSLPSKLTQLLCEYNNLASLPSLPQSLIELSCEYNKLTSLPAIPPMLTYLDCGDNNLTTLPPLPSSVYELQCSYNNLTSLPILPSSLTDLECYYNRLTSLPILPPLLNILKCYGNSLNTLPPLPDSLIFLDLRYNPNLKCLPPLKLFYGTWDYSFNILGTGIKCLSNKIQHPEIVSLPAADTVAVCDIFNQSGCEVAWNIEGHIFIDYNGNCLQDNSENNLYNIKLNLYQSGNLVQSGYFAGDYSFKTSLSTYKVAIDTNNLPFYISCPASGDSIVNVTSVDSLVYGVNFGVQCKPGFDMGVWDVHRAFGPHLSFFPGDTSKVYISAGDVVKEIFGASCSNGINGQVQITINGPVTYNAPLAGALTPTVNGNMLTYGIPDFSQVNSLTDFGFSVITNNSAQTGDSVCFDVSVTPIAGDNNLSNNTLEHCFTVSNSYDPNEKEVSPTGNLPLGYSDWLTYTIHFQNTGNAAAKHIQVLDTLDAGLDPETFQLLSYSFDPIVQINGKDVAFDFVNINLPDSTVSKTSSTGYVDYRVRPFNNLAGGTSINNHASIYFDFNAPIVTNTTTNTIELATGVGKVIAPVAVNVYPNPANTQLMVSCKQLAGAVIEVSDVLGRTAFVQTVLTNQTTLDVAPLTPGVYFLHIFSAGMNEVRKFVKE